MKKNEVKKINKNTIIWLVTFIIIIILIPTIFLGIRFIKVAKIVGTYEEIYSKEVLKIGLYNWSFGDKKNLKCDLWNCSGYESGNNYEPYQKTIKFINDKTSITLGYELNEDNNDTYLILKDNQKKDTSNTFEHVYKKIK